MSSIPEVETCFSPLPRRESEARHSALFAVAALALYVSEFRRKNRGQP